MLRAETFAPATGFGADDFAPPSAQQADGGASFSAAFHTLQADIRDTVEHGFADSTAATLSSPSLPSQLSAGGQAWLAAYLAGTDRAASEPGEGQAGLAGEAQREGFLREIAPWAQRAGEQLGTSPDIIAAHAALESNWGLQPVRSNGRNGYNLFGIKAGSAWQGGASASMTTEHVDGIDVRLPQRFRTYAGYGRAFDDYVRLLKDNPRYAAALNAGHDAHAFGRGLKQGGYATDADYENKLARVARQIQRMGRDGS